MSVHTFQIYYDDLKLIASVGKVMACMFCNSKGILSIDHLKDDTTITGNYFSNPFEELETKIYYRRPKEDGLV